MALFGLPALIREGVSWRDVRMRALAATPVELALPLPVADVDWGGVVGDVQLKPGFGDRGPLAAMPLAYIPLAQTSDGMVRLMHGWFSTAILVRAAGQADAIVPALRQAVDRVDPLLPFADVRPMAAVQEEAVALQRLLMVLLVTLAGAAVALTAIGIHGLIAATVIERTREIGIRMALGATGSQAILTLATPGILMALAGIAIGIVTARAAVTLVQSMVWGVSPSDPLTYLAVAGFFTAVAILSSVGPALRVLRMTPATTLRAD